MSTFINLSFTAISEFTLFLRKIYFFQFVSPPSSVQFSSVAQSCLILCSPTGCSTPGCPVHHHLQEPTQTYVHRVGDAIQPSHSLSSPSPILSLSQRQGLFQVFSGYSGNQSFSFSISPSSAYSGLISFTMDWFDLLVVQGALKSLLQHN